MEHFLLQRLYSKSHSLDKFDFLDKHSTIVRPLLPSCLLSSQEKPENSERPVNSSHLPTRLFLESFSSQRVKSLASKKYSSDISTLTTLRKNSLFNILDVCLNSKFLLTKTVLGKSADHFKFNFILSSILDDSLLLNSTSKLLGGREVKVFLLHKPLFIPIR